MNGVGDNVENKKSYYAIIPANVRYDKDLTMGARLLYGEITALCNEKGFCWASNEYFSQLYEVSKKTISVWINQLKDKKYIATEMNYKEGSKEIVNRYIRICSYPMEENVNTPMEEKVKDNNTSFNTTNNNMSEINSFFETIWKEYPKKEGKGSVSDAQKKELYKIGLDEMLRAIQRYKKAKINTDRKYLQMGSTFFNSGYVDYLDSNYTQEETKKIIIIDENPFLNGM